MSVGAFGLRQIGTFIEATANDLLQGVLAGGVLYYHGMALAADCLALDDQHRRSPEMTRTIGQAMAIACVPAGRLLRNQVRRLRELLRERRRLALAAAKDAAKQGFDKVRTTSSSTWDSVKQVFKPQGGYVTGPGLNGASALASPQCSAHVRLRPLATSRISRKISQPVSSMVALPRGDAAGIQIDQVRPLLRQRRARRDLDHRHQRQPVRLPSPVVKTCRFIDASCCVPQMKSLAGRGGEHQALRRRPAPRGWPPPDRRCCPPWRPSPAPSPPRSPARRACCRASGWRCGRRSPRARYSSYQRISRIRVARHVRRSRRAASAGARRRAPR